MRIDRAPGLKPKQKQLVPNEEEAESIAVEILSFLALDAERLDRFIKISGLSLESLREAAASPGFFVAILEYVTHDESLLTSFAANAGYDPTIIIHAKNRLSPEIDYF